MTDQKSSVELFDGLVSVHVLSAVSQVMSSARSILFLIGSAQILDTKAWGEVAFVVGLSLAANGVLRAAASHPLALVDHPAPNTLQHAIGHHVVLATGVAAIAAALAVALGEWTIALGLALYPGVAAHDAVRVGSLNQGRGSRAIAVDVTWLTLLALFFAIVGLAPVEAGEVAMLLMWAGTGAIAALAWIPAPRRPTRPGMAAWRLRSWPIGKRMVVEILLETIPTRLLPFLVVTSVAIEAAGGFRGAETLFGPATVAWSALSLSTLRTSRERFRTSGLRGASNHVVRMMSFAVLGLVINAGAVAALGDQFGSLAFSESWETVRPLVLPVGFLLLAQILMGVCSLIMRSSLQVERMIRLWALTAIVALPVVPLSAHRYGIRGAILADAAVIFLGACRGALELRRSRH